MNKTLKATYPISANLPSGWSNLNTHSIYWKVFESEGFVLGDLFSVGVFSKGIKTKKRIGEEANQGQKI